MMLRHAGVARPAVAVSFSAAFLAGSSLLHERASTLAESYGGQVLATWA
jgi:hypothetical protein